MNYQKQKALEAAGWRFGDAAGFLGMTEEQRQLLENARKSDKRRRKLGKTRGQPNGSGVQFEFISTEF